MIRTVADLQIFLNENAGANLLVDGKGGPMTRQAILNGFANRNAPAITLEDMAKFAARLGGTVKQLRAVSKVESAGGGFFDSGLPKALYERHYAWRRLKFKIPFLSDPTPGGYTMDADKDGINDSWEKIADMACRNPVVAFESASFGKFQVMGAHWSALGYTGPVEMVWTLRRSESDHYEQLCRYIEVNRLRSAFQQLSIRADDNRAFASGYNGKGYEKYSYHQKLAAAMH